MPSSPRSPSTAARAAGKPLVIVESPAKARTIGALLESVAKGNHSLKFGYEYEHVWMAVNDENNPLYGSWTYGGGSACAMRQSRPTARRQRAEQRRRRLRYRTRTGRTLFGATSSYQLANYFVVHLRQSLDSVYAQTTTGRWRRS